MIGRVIRTGTIAPLFLYGMALLAFGIRPLSAATVGLAIVIGLPAVAVVRPNLLAPMVGLSALMMGFVGAITVLTSGPPTGLGAELVVALLLGLFPWLLGVSVVLGDRPGVGLLGLTVGLIEIVSIGAAVPASFGRSLGPDGFVVRWYSAGGRQFDLLGQILAGKGLRSTGPFPYQSVIAPLLVGLAILALAGLLLPWLRSSPVGIRAPGAVPRRDMAAPTRTVPWPLNRGARAPVTRPVPGPGAGLAPIVGALLATGGFAAAAALAPVYAFLLAAAGATFVIVLLITLSFGARFRRGRGTPPIPAPRRRALSVPFDERAVVPAQPRAPP
ncbi:MAG: hypothetical protein L3K15_01750 [Thermoplasmata archaeon]|nr:hypothetical protein [Thermoplasmata archaeon]